MHIHTTIYIFVNTQRFEKAQSKSISLGNMLLEYTEIVQRVFLGKLCISLYLYVLILTSGSQPFYIIAMFCLE